MKITYTNEAIADLLDAITYLRERNPLAAVKLDAAIAGAINQLATQPLDGAEVRLRSGTLVRSWSVSRFWIYYQRHPGELLLVRVYHHSRRPMARRRRRTRRS